MFLCDQCSLIEGLERWDHLYKGDKVPFLALETGCASIEELSWYRWM